MPAEDHRSRVLHVNAMSRHCAAVRVGSVRITHSISIINSASLSCIVLPFRGCAMVDSIPPRAAPLGDRRFDLIRQHGMGRDAH